MCIKFLIVFLTCVFQRLTDYAREHALNLLFRMAVDMSLTGDNVICSELERTIKAILENISDEKVTTFSHYYVYSIQKLTRNELVIPSMHPTIAHHGKGPNLPKPNPSTNPTNLAKDLPTSIPSSLILPPWDSITVNQRTTSVQSPTTHRPPQGSPIQRQSLQDEKGTVRL